MQHPHRYATNDADATSPFTSRPTVGGASQGTAASSAHHGHNTFMIPASEILENPFAPSAPVGECVAAMKGTAEKWLREALLASGVLSNDGTIKVQKVAAVSAQFPKAVMHFLPQTAENSQAVPEAIAGSQSIDDRVALLWVWVNTENVTKTHMAMLILSLQCWHPYVHVRDYSDRILRGCAWNTNATLRTAEKKSLAALMIREPQYDCPDACVPDPNDVLDGTDSDISDVDYIQETENEKVTSGSAKKT